MSRSIQASVPSDKTGGIIDKLRGTDGVVGISLQRGASLMPPGDVLTIQVTNEAFTPIQGWLASTIGESGAVVISEPRSLVSPTSQTQIDEETNEASWPEMAALLRRETNVSSNYLLEMFFSGVVAAAGPKRAGRSDLRHDTNGRRLWPLEGLSRPSDGDRRGLLRHAERAHCKPRAHHLPRLA